MTVDRVIPCICAPDYEERKIECVYYAMPQLKVTDTYRGKQFFEAYCPNCGRGGLFQFKSAYLALKDWNKMQERLRMPLILVPVEDGET